MKPLPLWRVSVLTPPEAEEAVAELMERLFAQPPVSHTDLETATTTVSSFLNRKPLLARRRLNEGFERLRLCGLKVGAPRIQVRKIRREDWAQSWKRHFQPIEIGASLLIKPSWSRRRARRGQALVVLDPGLSFGTGRHPTTGFCLSQLAARAREGGKQAFLDVGAGSGILAISAARLGYGPVEAFDFDPEAVRVARENARLNGVSRRVRLRRRDFTRLSRRDWPRSYDVICANLIANLLLAKPRRLASWLSPGGLLVLAGILTVEFATMRRAYEGVGLEMVASRTEGEWTSGAFLKTRRG